MEKLYEITEEDIKEYFKSHKTDSNIKHREVMFIKYMRENEDISKENLQILLSKYNLEDPTVNNIGFSKMLETYLPSFPTYLSSIKKLDLSGICHIMIPATRFYGNVTKFKIIRTEKLLDELKIPYIGNEIYDTYLDAIHNYLISNQLAKVDDGYQINMTIPKAKRVLDEFEIIYGTLGVKKIGRIVKAKRI